MCARPLGRGVLQKVKNKQRSVSQWHLKCRKKTFNLCEYVDFFWKSPKNSEIGTNTLYAQGVLFFFLNTQAHSFSRMNGLCTRYSPSNCSLLKTHLPLSKEPLSSLHRLTFILYINPSLIPFHSSPWNNHNKAPVSVPNLFSKTSSSTSSRSLEVLSSQHT